MLRQHCQVEQQQQVRLAKLKIRLLLLKPFGVKPKGFMFYSGTHSLTNLYDSHVHWLYTGQLASTWNLKDITDPKQILSAKLKPEYDRGEWLTGFGWDENNWAKDFKIHREFLDQLSSARPIHLSRTDGHSSWVNTEALKRLGFLDTKSDKYKGFSKDIMLDENGIPNGHLKESAHMHALFNLPEPTDSLIRQFLIQGAEIFNRAGFTHIRDMTSSPSQWQLNLELLEDPNFILHSENWFVCEQAKSLREVLAALLHCKSQENQWMKIRGVKVFVDGSLGSETACLSHHYAGHGHSGQMIWNEEDVKTVLRETWKAKLEVAFHALGDQASHQVVQWAREVYSEGIQGYLHLEHVEILRPETILNMKSLHVRCHLQPCHWWGDQKWLKERVGSLFTFAFPWEALRKAQIPFSFGSDAPIEPTSFFSNLKALEDSATKGIKKLASKAEDFHVYPHHDSVTGSTQIIDDQIHSIKLGDKSRQYT